MAVLCLGEKTASSPQPHAGVLLIMEPLGKLLPGDGSFLRAPEGNASPSGLEGNMFQKRPRPREPVRGERVPCVVVCAGWIGGRRAEPCHIGPGLDTQDAGSHQTSTTVECAPMQGPILPTVAVARLVEWLAAALSPCPRKRRTKCARAAWHSWQDERHSRPRGGWLPATAR